MKKAQPKAKKERTRESILRSLARKHSKRLTFVPPELLDTIQANHNVEEINNGALGVAPFQEVQTGKGLKLSERFITEQLPDEFLEVAALMLSR